MITSIIDDIAIVTKLKKSISKLGGIRILLVLIILNIVLRIPFTTHERGFDSFSIHSMANSILLTGYVGWIIHPLSVVGLFPMSYPSGIPLLLAVSSSLTGINMEYMILFVSILFGVFGVFSIYPLAKELRNDGRSILLSMFIFSTSPIFLDYTTWTITTRGPFIPLIPLFIWSVIKCHKSKNKKKFAFFSILMFLLLTTVHRAAFLLLVFVFAYFISWFMLSLSKKIKLSTEHSKLLKKTTPFIFISCFLVLFFLQFSTLPIYRVIEFTPRAYDSFLFQNVRNPILILTNIGIHYMIKSGVLTILAPIGLVIVLRRLDSFKMLFISLSFLIFMGVTAFRVYTLLNLLPILAILTAFGFLNLKEMLDRRGIFLPAISLGLIFSILFSYLMLIHWTTPTAQGVYPYMESATHYAGKYLSRYVVAGDPVISSSGLIGVATNSDILQLPLSDTVYLAHNADKYSSIKTTPSLSSLRRSSLTPYELSGISTEDDLHYFNSRILGSSYDSLQIPPWYGVDKQDITYGVEQNVRESKSPKFFRSLWGEKDKIYDNGLEYIWYIFHEPPKYLS